MDVRRLLIAMTTTLWLTGSAAAATLYTPELDVPSGGCIDCRFIDVGGGSVTVTIELKGGTGATLTGPITCTAAPGTDGSGCIAGTCAPVSAYCKFTFSGSKNAVRAWGQIEEPGTANTVIRAE